MGREKFNALYLKRINLMKSSGKGSVLHWASFFPTMRFGKRKSVIWNDAALLGLFKRADLPGLLLIFLNPKKIARCKVTLHRAIMMED